MGSDHKVCLLWALIRLVPCRLGTSRKTMCDSVCRLWRHIRKMGKNAGERKETEIKKDREGITTM